MASLLRRKSLRIAAGNAVRFDAGLARNVRALTAKEKANAGMSSTRVAHATRRESLATKFVLHVEEKVGA